MEEAAKDLERQHKAVAQQLSDFDTMKKSLMRDLQDRCEKVKRGVSPREFDWRADRKRYRQVVELEISLDEARENYRNLAKNSNSKTQQRKMDFLTRNLDQLTVVQKQVSARIDIAPSPVAWFGCTAVDSLSTDSRIGVPQLVDQNSTLKRDVALAERKLIARNERIQNLEALLLDANEKVNQQNAKFEARLQAVRERLDQARGTSSSPMFSSFFAAMSLCSSDARFTQHSAKPACRNVQPEFRSHCQASAGRWRRRRGDLVSFLLCFFRLFSNRVSRLTRFWVPRPTSERRASGFFARFGSPAR